MTARILTVCSQESRELLRKMNQLLQEFDDDQSGDLDMRELKNLITHHEIRYGRDMPVVPSEMEISWILQAAGKHRANAIDATELDFALNLWDVYVKNRPKMENVLLVRIDTNQRLEFDQLKFYLTKLTGFAPTVGEIHKDFVRSHKDLDTQRSHLEFY
jgi:hypothetical protein